MYVYIYIYIYIAIHIYLPQLRLPRPLAEAAREALAGLDGPEPRVALLVQSYLSNAASLVCIMCFPLCLGSP